MSDLALTCKQRGALERAVSLSRGAKSKDVRGRLVALQSPSGHGKWLVASEALKKIGYEALEWDALMSAAQYPKLLGCSFFGTTNGYGGIVDLTLQSERKMLDDLFEDEMRRPHLGYRRGPSPQTLGTQASC